MKKENKIKFGIPIGYISKAAINLFAKAGYSLKLDEKFQKAEIDEPGVECFIARPIEIVPFVEKGILDAGIASQAAVLEKKAKVIEVFDFDFDTGIWRKAEVVLAVPNNSSIKSLKELKGKKIVTRIPEIAKEFLKRNRIAAKIVYIDMPVNNALKIPLYGEAVIELTPTWGGPLEFYQFRILKTLMKSGLNLIVNENSLRDKWKKEKIENLGLLLKGARVAQEYSGLMLHASNDMMEKVLRVLPSLKKPTVTRLRGENWFDVFTVAKKKEIRELIPKLKKIGCRDIVEIPLNKVVV